MSEVACVQAAALAQGLCSQAARSGWQVARQIRACSRALLLNEVKE